jgi:hypothetical protein
MGRAKSATTMSRELSIPELKQLDLTIDANFEQSALPAQDLYAARWALLTAGENCMRWAMHKAAAKETNTELEAELESTNIEVDLYKYRLQHSLALCARRLPKVERNGIHNIEGDELLRTHHLLFEPATKYSYATHIMWSAFSGHFKICHDKETDRYDVILQPRFAAYGVLDRLLVSDQAASRNPYTMLIVLFQASVIRAVAGKFRKALQPTGPLGEAALDIVERVKHKRSHISYQMITRLAKGIADEIDYGPSIIPPDWRFPWGTPSDVDRFFTGLHARCIYHLLSIHFGELRYSTSTSDQSCLWLDQPVLINDLARITDLSERQVKCIVTALTLGEETKNPDPALQPFVPVGPGRIALPGIFIVSSRHRRNLLSLQTRVAKGAFDSASGVFEQLMTKDIIERIGSLVVCRPDVWVPSSSDAEQVDLLLADPINNFILVCELRWMLMPGDPREVHQRIGDFGKKVAQAERKLSTARGAIPEVQAILGLDAQRDWKLGAIVIVDGMAGIPSPKPNFIPIVAKEIFIKVLTLTKDLNRAHAVFCSPLWLPHEGSDYQGTYEDAEVCGVRFGHGSISLTGRSYLNDSLPRYVVESACRSPDELRTEPW